MSATIIPFPKMAKPHDSGLSPKKATRHERMAELIYQRAQRSGISCSLSQARSSVEKAIAGPKGGVA